MLAQSTFVDLGQQPSNDISFLLPKVPSTLTELHFDESTTWYIVLRTDVLAFWGAAEGAGCTVPDAV